MPSIITGLLALALGLWSLTIWWWSVVEFLRGFVPLALIVLGLVALAAGVSAVRQAKDVNDEDLLGVEE
ncbi:hypothetical protein JCM17960_07830 [Magnetospira thiophila]